MNKPMEYLPNDYVEGMSRIEAAHAAMDYDDDPPEPPMSPAEAYLCGLAWVLSAACLVSLVLVLL